VDIGYLARYLVWCVGQVITAPFKLPWRLTARGFEHFPWRGPMILACNHQSYWDPPAAGAVSPRPLHFMARRSLFKNPIFGALITVMSAFPVERDKADPKAVRAALDILRKGRALLIFPEGTRSRNGQLGAAREGVGMLALRSGAPVIPCYLQNTNRITPKGARFLHFPKITVHIGAAVALGDLAGGELGREVYQQAADRIMAAIAKLRDEAVNASRKD
jgi:1-acyl-sn-glycerol-3-phosphate acyltransferase